MRIRTPLVVTIGDPAGIGPEICLKAAKALDNTIPFFVIADIDVITPLANKLNLTINKIEKPEEVFNSKGGLSVLNRKVPHLVNYGRANILNSSYVIENIKLAVKLVLTKRCSGLVTSPISKSCLHEGANFSFSGHTEFLAHLTNSKRKPVMMITAGNFRVIPVTTHIPIKDVSTTLTKNLLRSSIVTIVDDLKDKFAIKDPRLLITGLNPHAGEAGYLGTEEEAIIKPIITELKAKGQKIVGPVSADTAFLPSNIKKYDAFVCMYHDQALIPIKIKNFDTGVNITLGIPIIRTSPDHGTAFDIAEQFKANPLSMINAIKIAFKIVKNQS